MDNGAEVLLGSYQQLIELTKQQLEMSEQEQERENLEDVLQLEEKKTSYRELIDQLQLEPGSQTLTSEQRDSILLLNNQLQTLTTNLKEKISSWYDETSTSMKQISDKRTTLRTYGGVNYSDMISIYFDQRK